MDLLAGLAQGQGAGLLPRAEAAFWRRKPCLAECHRSRRMRRRGEQSGRLGCWNSNMEHKCTNHQIVKRKLLPACSLPSTYHSSAMDYN